MARVARFKIPKRRSLNQSRKGELLVTDTSTTSKMRAKVLVTDTSTTLKMRAKVLGSSC